VAAEQNKFPRPSEDHRVPESQSHQQTLIDLHLHDVLNRILFVNLGHMSSDGYVTRIARRMSQLARKDHALSDVPLSGALNPEGNLPVAVTPRRETVCPDF
jgi:hypothetical protein